MKLLWALGLLLLTSCQTPAPRPPAPSAASQSQSDDLSLAEAQTRAARLSGIDYTLSVDLTAPGNAFEGKAIIRFAVNDVAQPLRLDFYEGTIHKLALNGKPLGPEAKKPYWIELPAAGLKLDANEVMVEYAHDFAHDGRGLHRFQDQKTKDVYLYSQFETFDAHRFMPCFDQPDLRASLKLDVVAPKEWTVVSTAHEASVKEHGTTKRWDFPPTPKIATYLYSLHAGPFKIWSDAYRGRPLRIFARKEMAPYIPSKEMFTITKQGMKFYDAYFGYEYPFSKLDQVIVPEFNAGGMENVAAITYSENLFSRSQMTRIERRRTFYVVLHEIAHMWFGDLVTMKWWNDLWLNESFATVMGTMAEAEATEYKEAWVHFNFNQKGWAYFEDGLVTTHPIEGDVPSVLTGDANFDGITYGKGAAVLKQLIAYMGPENFKSGLQSYIAAYAFKNADLQQFITSLQTKTDKDLNGWADRWLKQSGSDQLHSNWTCDGPRLKTIEITSDAAGSARFRPQTVKVALFGFENGKFTKPTVLPLEMNQAHNTLTGDWACPKLVYPNYEDLGYARVGLDQDSAIFVQHHINAIPDPLLRIMLWGDLFQMVTTAQLPVVTFSTILQSGLAEERDLTLLQRQAATLTGSRILRDDILSLWPRSSSAEFVDTTADILLRRLRAAKTVDEKKFFFDWYVRLSNTPKTLDLLPKWFKGKDVGFKLDPDRKWNLVMHMNRFAVPDAASALSEMKAEDKSEPGRRNAMVAEVIRPGVENKKIWFETLSAMPPKYPYSTERQLMWELFPLEQSAAAATFADPYFAYLAKNGRSPEADYVETFGAYATPLNCDGAMSERARQFQLAHPEFTPKLTKALKINLQLDQRCQKIRGGT